MSEDKDLEQSLVTCFEVMLRRAGAELADALGAAATTTVVFSGQRALEGWAEDLGGPCLLVSGSVRGEVEGPVACVLRTDDAARFAGRANGGEPGEEAESPGEPLSEAATAAVVFALSRIGAAATEAWEADLGAKVQWPSEAGELAATLADFSDGTGVCSSVMADASALVGLTVSLGGPVGVEVLVLLPIEMAEALTRLAARGTHAAAPRARADAPTPLEPLGDAEFARLAPITVWVRAVVAQRTATLRELLDLEPGRVLDLTKRYDEPLELAVGAKVVALGEAVLASGRVGLRVAQLGTS